MAVKLDSGAENRVPHLEYRVPNIDHNSISLTKLDFSFKALAAQQWAPLNQLAAAPDAFHPLRTVREETRSLGPILK